jgi:hypothetical protein
VFKRCPECRVEFQEWVEQCPDCHVALVSAEAPLPEPEAPRELPPASELLCLERGDPPHLRQLAEQLHAEGVSCRIDAYPPAGGSGASARAPGGGSFGLYVLAEQAQAAISLRNAHLESVVPDSAGLNEGAGAELADCPACGERLPEGAAACESCGLEFPELAPE